MTMELSMTIALVSALAIREVFTALVIVFFVLIAEVLEELTVGRGRRAIQDLLNLLPQQVELRGADGIQSASLADLRTGDVVLVRPGGRVPVDGVVVGGHSFIDQATITGESMPVEKIPGARVYAGTVNQSGVLEIRTETVGSDTAFGKIIEAVEQAEHSRAPVQKTADRLAGYLVYFALICAAFHLSPHAQRALHDFGGDRGRRVRHRGRHTAGHPGRHRTRGPARHDREGRLVYGNPRQGGYRGSR